MVVAKTILYSSLHIFHQMILREVSVLRYLLSLECCAFVFITIKNNGSHNFITFIFLTLATQIATANTAAIDSFVWYRIIINEELSRVTTIKVKEGEYIDSIIRGIKLQSNVLLAFVDPTQIYLFESIESAEPFDDSTYWNTNVKWGKFETPMIVRVRPLPISPWNNNEGMRF
jgi:hypothetical protein